ncbi:MAG: primase-helicase zinc-binding domain-containing protein [Smithella sp.]|jgi:putative DNA primase/helicase
MEIESIKQQAQGRWLGIFEQFGIDPGNGKHGPCPFCGGKDRYRYTDKNGGGEYFCNQCGYGDGFDLIQKVTGIEFKDVLNKVSEMIGVVKMDKPKQTNNIDAKKMLNDLWKASKPLTGSDPVSKYLHSRKIVLTPENIRYCQKCYEKDTNKEYPAMIARIQNAEGKPISLHRTYLSDNGKADVPSPKKTMTPTEPIAGGAIRLFMPGGLFDAETLGVAEGIESAMSAAQIYSIATWSVISTSIMEKWIPPKEFKKIIIFADNDKSCAGGKAAYTLAAELYRKDYLVEVMMPPPGDFNDQLMRG